MVLTLEGVAWRGASRSWLVGTVRPFSFLLTRPDASLLCYDLSGTLGSRGGDFQDFENIMNMFLKIVSFFFPPKNLFYLKGRERDGEKSSFNSFTAQMPATARMEPNQSQEPVPPCGSPVRVAGTGAPVSPCAASRDTHGQEAGSETGSRGLQQGLGSYVGVPRGD